ncbi:MAG: hypothetical protein ACKPBB_01170 [Sphaerospermopsis kisseleviana]
MVVWGFDIGDRHLRFRRFCIKSILKGIQKYEITDCDTGGCGMWVYHLLVGLKKEVEDLNFWISEKYRTYARCD